jgi:hypothetical protein
MPGGDPSVADLACLLQVFAGQGLFAETMDLVSVHPGPAELLAHLGNQDQRIAGPQAYSDLGVPDHLPYRLIK